MDFAILAVVVAGCIGIASFFYRYPIVWDNDEAAFGATPSGKTASTKIASAETASSARVGSYSRGSHSRDVSAS
jgi:hypothetical protein